MTFAITFILIEIPLFITLVFMPEHASVLELIIINQQIN